MGLAEKRALIVDDSKSARAFLSRILEKYEVAVDTAESAEQALDYLGDHRPDVIFMDHLMPGMDGFQALQSIKNNPRTAMIPIMMYTSQEGELYLGQARALGAIGVLPKQIKPADVSRVLYQLRILPERRGAESQTSFTVVNVGPDSRSPSARPAREPPQLRVVSNDASGPSTADLRALVESVVEQHMGDLHRSVTASLDAQSERLLGDVRVAVQDAIAHPAAAENPEAAFSLPRPQAAKDRWAWGAAAVATIAAAVLGFMWWQEASERRELMTQLLAVKQDSVALSERLNGELRAARATAADPTAGSGGAAVDSGVQRLPVPYGEVALSGERLESLRGLLAKLQTDAFRGTVQITTFPGRYCVQKTADGFELAGDALPASKCDLVGNPFDDGLTTAQREPLAFANFAGSIRQQSRGTIRVQMANGAADVTAATYPASSDKLTAGEWNRAAAANNRIEVRLEPAANAAPGE